MLLAIYIVVQSTPVVGVEPKSTKAQRQEAKKLHDSAVSAYQSGASLDSPTPPEIVAKFPKSTTERIEIKGSNGSQQDRVKTIREILTESEATLGQGPEVELQLESTPLACQIEYKPVIGGNSVYLGLTNLTQTVKPKYYQITCKCKEQQITKTVDCTQSQKITFYCDDAKK